MSQSPFTAIKTEGGLLPRDILERVAAEDPDLAGTRADDYHLHAPAERLGEAISRSWNHLLGLWEVFSEALEGLDERDAAIRLTRDRWLLPLFDELGYGRLQRSTAVEIEGKSFAISHAWNRTPIHLVGAGVGIDRRSKGVAGAAVAAPHSLVQEFLNRSEDHLWAFVSNGRLLRVLRDNHSLSRQAYVEFDLEAIMEGELFSDFRLLWLICHQSRVEALEPEECWLETWFKVSREEGVRALDALRDGVEQAIEALGAGFLRHPANERLHEGLQSGELDRQDYYRELLRLIYRLIFLFVAEDRDALLDPDADATARERYTRYYASSRLRELAGRRRGTAHDDLWRGLRLVLSKLHNGTLELGLPALGSFLWSPDAASWISDAELRNDDLLSALRALCYTQQDHQLLPVNWRTLGSEELGSVYESLLELHPRINRDAGTFELDTAAGHERKTTGSYYTPTSLVDRLLESALEPVLEEAMRSDDAETALLDLKVCDTAAGSGHFLVAAARRIALRLASVRTGDEEASPQAVTEALRDVVGRCIYGVDLNPLAVELCKVSLWMEALEPGKPLSFLDHHIQLGNSLLGTTPHLLQQGIPTDAFQDIEGDDHDVVLQLRARNRTERESEQIGFHTQMVAEASVDYGAIETLLEVLNRADDSTFEAVQEKEARYRRLLDDPRYRSERLAADTWCSAFFWRKIERVPPAITEDVFRQIQHKPDDAPEAIIAEVRRLANRYRFFHFHVAFPDVFSAREGGETDGVTGWPSGFDVVLGNPPWEHTELKEKEWFAGRAPEIASASGAKRKRMIAALEEEDPVLFNAFLQAKRDADGLSHLTRNSGRYPLCGRGRINTYAIFAEGNRQILAPEGRMGIIVPSGIATDATTQYFFQDLMDTGALISLYDFENRDALFPGVHRSYKFCLLTVGGEAQQHDGGAEFAFFLHSTKQLDDDERAFALNREDVALLNPNTRTCPIFRSRRDAELTKSVYRRFPVLSRDDDPEGNPWNVTFRQGLFNMTSDSHLFRSREELKEEGWALSGNTFVKENARYLPLYEAKMLHHFDHRWATFEAGEFRDVTLAEKDHCNYLPLPRYWVPSKEVAVRLDRLGWEQRWIPTYRWITNTTNERTMLSSVAPAFGFGNSSPVIATEPLPDGMSLALPVVLSSFLVDYIVRQKLGGTNLAFNIVYQIPVIAPESLRHQPEWAAAKSLGFWIVQRAFELYYTADDLKPLASEVGFQGEPFRWDEERRFLLRCELDAALFHAYGIGERDVAYILDTFPIVRRKDEAEYGEYRTKRVIIEIYQEMAEAAAAASTYRTRLDPPPADPAVTHPSTD